MYQNKSLYLYIRFYIIINNYKRNLLIYSILLFCGCDPSYGLKIIALTLGTSNLSALSFDSIILGSAADAVLATTENRNIETKTPIILTVLLLLGVLMQW